VEKAGSALVGVAGVALPYKGGWLIVDDLPVLMVNGKAWATWPAKPLLTKEGSVARIPGTGKVKYVNILHWEGPGVAARFSQTVVGLVRQRDPSAFEREGEA
jgi:hypothetical protein